MSNMPLGEECRCGNAHSMCECPDDKPEKVIPHCIECGDDLEELIGTEWEGDLTCGLCDMEIAAGER